ncbi:hypothetical protein AAFX91_21885 [Bradyrhizobium sp. 31Argb]|uniref:hypothetical protein n=1 Tax=Bradyrhizobium sp. 31Argb TaxID=3141247 RepID=UPI003748DFD3
MFVVYDQDGKITSSIAGPGLEYGIEVLDAQGKSWLFLAGVTSLDPVVNYVDVAAAAARTNRYVPKDAIADVVKANRPIALVASKSEIVADGIDAATISGIPAGAAVTIVCNGLELASAVIDDGNIELTAISAGVYHVLVSRPTFNPASIEVMAS